tara:strand:- start:60 stop:371 length:312 start_codon:yes stop_codon:yes gene_type:complete
MAYALGKYSQAQCDRCGFVYSYNKLKEEWNGLRVCSVCFEEKHPQLEPLRKAADPESLKHPRPTESAPTTGFGIIRTKDDIIGSSFNMKSVTGSLGTVTVTTG